MHRNLVKKYILRLFALEIHKNITIINHNIINKFGEIFDIPV